MNKHFLKKKITIYSPQNKILNYCFLADYLLKSDEIEFLSEKTILKNNSQEIFVDVNNLKNFLNTKFDNLNKTIFIVLWNNSFDYFKHNLTIGLLKNKFSQVKLIYLDREKFNSKFNALSLSDFSISKKRTLKKIKGINFIKYIKYFFPTLSSLYNFFKHPRTSMFFLKTKLVFVGRGDLEDVISAFKVLQLSHNKYTRNLISLSLKRLTNLNSINTNNLFELFNNRNFLKMESHEKTYFLRLIFRLILIDHLSNFKCFFHQNKKKPFIDLLNSNIYKNIYQLDLGSLCSNTPNYHRALLINRFYKNFNIKIEILKNNTIYSNSKLLKRINIIQNYLIEFKKFNEFNCDGNYFIKKMIKLNNSYLK